MQIVCDKTETHARHVGYANMQGRNLCDDMALSAGGEGPDYDKVTLKIPVNMFYARGGAKGNTIYDADGSVTVAKNKIPTMMGRLFKKLEGVEDETLLKTPMLDIPVGWWGGRVPSSGLTFSDNVVSNLRWGWGHPCNVFQVQGPPPAPPGLLPGAFAGGQAIALPFFLL